MNDRELKKNEIENLQQAVMESHLLRLAGFSNQIDRLIVIKLKKKINRMKLMALVALTANGGTLTPSELGKHILRTNDHVSKFTDALVKDGVVTRHRKGKDRRNVQIKITLSGLDIVKKILAEIKDEEIFIESCLEERDFQKFEQLLKEFRCGLIKKRGSL